MKHAKGVRRRAHDPCPYCGRPLSEDFFIRREIRRGNKISEALKNAERVGRRRKCDYQKVYELRDKGFSIMKISYALNVSRGAIQNALKLRGEP